MPDVSPFRGMASADVFEIEKVCQKYKRMISEHLCTGRFRTLILFGSESPWDPDTEVKDFVIETPKKSGYDLVYFGL